VLTIIESGSNVWMAITVDDELRIYSRAEAGDWGELSVSEDSEQVDPEKSFMLEELYGRQNGQEEEDEEAGLEGDEEMPDEEEEPDDEEEEPDEDGPELDEDEESEDGEDEEPEEEEKPRRRRAASAKSGRTAARRK
jgi:cobalamin biosynthesis protein CobT